MKCSLSWLKDYADIRVSADKLAHRLTMAGMEVEKIEDIGSDKVFELEITPNRPDCLNMIGLAREAAAVLNKKLRLPKKTKIRFPAKKADVTIQDKRDCPRYIGTVIRDVTVGPSPAWMQERLVSVGMRPINNIVDITNFCLMETGQPLHAFDYDKLQGNKIIVRRARSGEKILTLDGEEKDLDPSVLIIADVQRPVAIAGIMGGEETQVTERTRHILLESAAFDSVLIRRAVRALGLASESSYRFERGVDVCSTKAATARAVGLILDTAGGKVERIADCFASKKLCRPGSIAVDPQWVEESLGAVCSPAKMKTILKRLGCGVSSGKKQALRVVPPSFRQDLRREVDIIEEIARIIGYDNLPMSLPPVAYSLVPEDTRRQFKGAVIKNLQASGLHEVISYSLVSRDAVEATGLTPESCLGVKNAVTQDQALYRCSLLPGLLADIRLNINRQEKDLRFFEVGHCFTETGEEDWAGIIMTGQRSPDWRTTGRGEIDFFDLKGVVTGLMAGLHADKVRFEAQPVSVFSDQESAGLFLSGRQVGRAGRLHPDVLGKWDIRQQNVYYAEISLAALQKGVLRPRPRQYQPYSEYPAVARDVSLAVKNDIMYQQVRDICLGHGGELLQEVRFLEQYLGEKIAAGQRGLVFSLIYRSSRRTLREDEVNDVHQRVLDTLTQQLGATVR